MRQLQRVPVTVAEPCAVQPLSFLWLGLVTVCMARWKVFSAAGPGSVPVAGLSLRVFSISVETPPKVVSVLVAVLFAGAAAVVALVATHTPDDAAQYRCGSEAGAD